MHNWSPSITFQNTTRSIPKMINSNCGIIQYNKCLIKFEHILRSWVFLWWKFTSPEYWSNPPKYTVVCKPNSHSLPYWFYTEGRVHIGPGWLDMIISLYWSELQTVHLLGIVNDIPNRWPSECLFMYKNINRYSLV